ncbi:MAG: RNA-binding protein [Nitrososphaerota archaeon]|nr:RNA-binding protein [Nitrososphaerota archaeon]MDG6916683.1 RNA-binding protein [Nitrososphaerota archaeon]MDG6917869.1 RNA-binding protein [Nitrososphaerota archaeon]MDG6946392.1 RNA-binding protein [Nitrososphaerota archaeon]MDG6947842.1 RNA-binding protein [Nitrososphaerota archaeon]
MDAVRRSLKAMEARFSEQLERRDRVIKGSRDVITASSRAIISVHLGKTKDAERELSKAKSLLKELKQGMDGSLSRYVVSPETEVVEASVVVSLAKGKPIPSMESIDSSPEAYLLGLLDVVGELKRLVLDSILGRDLGGAKKYFEVMEDLYAACSPLAVYDHVVNGARRKIDVARMLVEDTRGLLAEEIGRSSVSDAMAQLEKKLGRSA